MVLTLECGALQAILYKKGEDDDERGVAQVSFIEGTTMGNTALVKKNRCIRYPYKSMGYS